MGGIKKAIWHEGGRIDEYCYLDKWSERTAETDMQSNYAILGFKNIVGIYKFFYYNQEQESCFYIGISTNVARRLLSCDKGHIHMYLNEDFSKLVPQKIREYHDKRYKIKVTVQEID